MKGFRLDYEHKFVLKDVPKQWIPKFELYYPDLPGYPIVYIHVMHNKKRIYGFPVTVSFNIHDDVCDVNLVFLSNVNLDLDNDAAKAVKNELEERFGISMKIGRKNIGIMCKGNKKYENFFQKLWEYIEKVSGSYVPYGRLYDETFSIVRFVSAFSPKTGRQSEMRMMYNFMSIFGERVEIQNNWKFLHFFVIPTYDEILGCNLSEFPEFQKIYGAMQKIWDKEYTKKIELDNMNVKSMKKAWPHTMDKLVRDVLSKMLREQFITQQDNFLLGRLVDAFNRYPRRTAFFIWSIMSIADNDYRKWDKKMFVEFYTNTVSGSLTKTVGVSQKVVACFLQQGFGKKEMIPIDTWIESFHKHALGIKGKNEFFESFDNMGEMERLIWVAAQSKKTNMTEFLDILWCIRYGDRGNNEIRGANPISCYECKLKESCPSYDKIKKNKIMFKESASNDLEEMYTKRGKFKGQKLKNEKVGEKADNANCRFICITRNDVPKKILVKQKNRWKLIDEFSGNILNNDNKMSKYPEIMTTEEMIQNLGKFKRHVDVTEVTD